MSYFQNYKYYILIRYTHNIFVNITQTLILSLKYTATKTKKSQKKQTEVTHVPWFVVVVLPMRRI